jgi:drug/metabolite transporter (DMT)-like permease
MASDRASAAAAPGRPTVAQDFPPQLYGLLAALTLFWGCNWPIMKIALSEIAPMHFRTLFLASGAIGLFAIAIANRLPLRVPAGEWPRLLAIAVVNMVGWNVLAIYGVPLLASGRASILGYTMPVWGVLLSAWLLGERLTRRRLLGVAMGVTGMLLLLGEEVAAVGRSPLGAILLVSAAVTWALGTVMMRRWPVDLPTTSVTAWQMVIALVPISTIAVATETSTFNPFALSTGPMLCTLYNMSISAIFGYWAWTKIATSAPVMLFSLGTMMTPVVGVFSGMLMLGERPHATDFAALVLVVAALAIVLLPARQTGSAPG